MEWLSWCVIGVAFLIAIANVVWAIKSKGLRQTAIDFICEAEERFNKGENDEKFSYVLNLVYARLPVIVQVLVPESTVKRFIQNVFDEIKKALDVQPKIENQEVEVNE